MGVALMLLAILLATALQYFPKEVRAGTAVTTKDGRLCMSMPVPVLTPGEGVILVAPTSPQSWSRTTVVGPVAACEPLDRADIAGPYYALRGGVPPTSEPGGLFIALPSAAMVRTDRGAVVVRIGDAYRRARVDACTSNEGVHLRIWSGPPGDSKVLWHEYFYVPYDTEPTCKF
jgi:hypothetical protein